MAWHELLAIATGAIVGILGYLIRSRDVIIERSADRIHALEIKISVLESIEARRREETTGRYSIVDAERKP